jgi:bifunctional non-homologous end joining protein LigD
MQPMLATLADAPLVDPSLVYEPKYDGIRALISVAPRGGRVEVAIASRLGNDKTAQFPEVVEALEAWGRGRRAGALFDGEIVALDAAGDPVGFEKLQERIHLVSAREVARLAAAKPVAFVIFDLLRDGAEDLCALPLSDRRRRLEGALDGTDDRGTLRIARQVRGDGAPLMAEARARGWEGIIAKDARSIYRPGRRTRDWRKLKLVQRQELVVGGYTEPRNSRAWFGALLLGLPMAGGRLRYAGHVGGGFTDKELAYVGGLLRSREIASSPFETSPPANGKPHWVRPDLVVEVKFAEWTEEGYLRQPIYLGLREDIPADTVRKTEPVAPAAPSAARGTKRSRQAEPSGRAEPRVQDAETGRRPRPRVQDAETSLRAGPGVQDAETSLRAGPGMQDAEASRRRPKASPGRVARAPAGGHELQKLIAALDELEARGGGRLDLPGGAALDLGNLGKKLWPDLGLTKGDLLRYYVAVSPQLLPVVRDRPLVMRRLPDGISGPAFYQHRAPDEVPRGVRAERISPDDDVPTRFVGGDLATLLHMAQLAAISQDPWFSRARSPDDMDFAAIDLDPMDEAPFSRVRDVARWVHDELVALGVIGFLKTSGASGLHIYLPLPPGTPFEAGMLFCQIIASIVASKHPEAATVERTVKKRDPKSVYVDYLQNVPGKTLACAYSARASDYAGASTPLAWEELDERLDPRAFTIRSLPARLAAVGDLWAALGRSPGIDLPATLDRVRARHT